MCSPSPPRWYPSFQRYTALLQEKEGVRAYFPRSGLLFPQVCGRRSYLAVGPAPFEPLASAAPSDFSSVAQSTPGARVETYSPSLRDLTLSLCDEFPDRLVAEADMRMTVPPS